MKKKIQNVKTLRQDKKKFSIFLFIIVNKAEWAGGTHLMAI